MVAGQKTQPRATRKQSNNAQGADTAAIMEPVGDLTDLQCFENAQASTELTHSPRPAPQKRRGRPPGSSNANTKKAASRAGQYSESQLEPADLSQRHTSVRSEDSLSNQANGSRDKRSRRRLRNCEAAQKCRERKQRGVNDLQNREAVASTLHDALANEASQLKGEVLLLKNMILQHHGCGCSFIEEYIQGQAANLVHGISCDGTSPSAASDRSGATDTKPAQWAMESPLSSSNADFFGPSSGSMEGEMDMSYGYNDLHGGVSEALLELPGDGQTSCSVVYGVEGSHGEKAFFFRTV